MKSHSLAFRLLPALILSLFAGLPATRAEEAKGPPPEIPAEKYFKNIRVFQGFPSTQIDGAMDFMSASLGVKCGHCHVTAKDGPWPMEKDDKAAKLTARQMIQMTREINKANFEGKRVVTCATCHQGHVLPAPLPPMLAAAPLAPPPDRDARKTPLPSLKDVLARYTEALGGRQAFARIRSRVTEGTFTGADGKPQPLQIAQEAPDKYVWTVTTKEGPFSRGFDGKTGWNRQGNVVEAMEEDELPGMRRRAAFFQDIDLKDRYGVLAVSGRESREGREVILVEGRATDSQREELSFDSATGLLVRRLEYRETALGTLPSETDYEDYRDVDGVKLPFTVRRVSPRSRQVEQYSGIRQNVAIEEATFRMPSTK